jgi:hypothetical protein
VEESQGVILARVVELKNWHEFPARGSRGLLYLIANRSRTVGHMYQTTITSPVSQLPPVQKEKLPLYVHAGFT